MRSNASLAERRRELAARGEAACDLLRVPDGNATIVVACSGGSDSAAALEIVRRARPRARIFACYIDHRMRPRSSIARDLRAVRAQAKVAGAQVAALRLAGARLAGESPEASMRSARYAALASFAASVGASCVITGHNGGDLAETVLLALIRGSGIDGVGAMRPRRAIGHAVDLARPLLWASKRELEEYARSAGLQVSIDETNTDRHYRRNALRELLAGLETAVPGALRAIARSAAIVADEKTILDAVTRSAWRACDARRADGALVASALRALPLPLLRRVVRYEVRHAAGTARDFSFDHCTAIARAIIERRGGRFHAGSATVHLSSGRMTTIASTARSSTAPAAMTLVVPQREAHVDWGGGKIAMRIVDGASRRSKPARAVSGDGCVRLDAGVIAPGTTVTIRAPVIGDRFVPAGRATPLSLARFLAKAGVTRDRRKSVPLLCRGDSVTAVLGVRAGAGFATRSGKPVLEVWWTPPKLV